MKEQVHTDANGTYVIKATPGTYSLQVEAPGFAVVTQQITLGRGASTVDVTLTVGQESNSITVSASSGYVDVQSSTGTKSDSALLEKPQSISTVTREQIDDQGAQTIDEALRYTAGVYTQDGTDLRFDQLNGRGFALDSYLDDLRLNGSPRFATPRVDPYLLDRIDVLHGPSSVLYGQGNPGGLVNYVSKRPRIMSVPFHEVTLQLGNYNYYQLDFDLGGPANKSDTVFYRITGLGRIANTQVDVIKDHRAAIAPALTFRPDSNTSLTFLSGYQHDPRGGLFNPVPASGTVFANPNGRLGPSQYFGNPNTDRMNRTQYWIGDQFEHRLNDVWCVSQTLRYLYIDERYYQTSVTSGFQADNRTVLMYGNIDNEHFGQFTTDAHAQARFSTAGLKHTLLFGFDYQNVPLADQVANTASYTGAVVGTLDLFAPDYSKLTVLTPSFGPRFRYVLWQAGGYGQDEIRFHKLVLNLGAREDGTATNVQAPVSGQILKENSADRKLSWRTGLTYDLAKGLVPYASYTTSFAPQLGTTAQGSPFKPMLGKQYETGIRYKPKGDVAYFTVAAFDLREDNVATTDPNNPNLSVQTGQVRSRGIEAEAHANVSNDLKLIATYTYLDQWITSDTNFLGKRPVIAPRNAATLWGNYTLPSGPLRNFGFGAGVRYQGDSEGSQANTFQVPGRTLMDAAAHYDWKSWHLGVNASNLLNHEYVSYCSSAATCYWGATRTVLGTVDFKW